MSPLDNITLMIVVMALAGIVVAAGIGYFLGVEEGRHREHQKLQETIDAVLRNLHPEDAD